MYSFRKSKKGFTLIELMVVVAIIGILALLGLRLYTGQQNKAKSAIVIANASTVHTLIQGDLLDHNYDATTLEGNILNNIAENGVGTPVQVLTALANMKNPFNSAGNIVKIGTIGTGAVGEVIIDYISPNVFHIQGIGSATDMETGEIMTAQQ